MEDAAFLNKIQYGWYNALDTVRIVRMSLQMLVQGQVAFSDMGGPVMIVDQMSQVAAESSSALDALVNMLYYGGFIAINLAVMNLLPIPALDGGRIVGVLITTAVEGNTKIAVSGIDIQKVGQHAANIKKVRSPEPYKGKGVRYAGEYIRIKEGKTGK